jgi:hypothetical protein
MRTFRFIATALLLLMPLALHAADPFLGKWSLDVKRSKYPAGGCPIRMIVEMSSAGQGVHYHSESISANGNLVSADYTADYDEKSVMVMGARGMLLPVSLKRAGPRVVIATYESGFRVMATSRRVVSADGSLMTITTTSQDRAGKPVTNVGVYTRIKSAMTGPFIPKKSRRQVIASK